MPSNMAKQINEKLYKDWTELRWLSWGTFLIKKSFSGKLRDVEQELEAVGENMKQLEISAEKAQEREEKLKDKIHQLMERLKVAEARYEYGEMNISKLNLR